MSNNYAKYIGLNPQAQAKQYAKDCNIVNKVKYIFNAIYIYRLKQNKGKSIFCYLSTYYICNKFFFVRPTKRRETNNYFKNEINKTNKLEVQKSTILHCTQFKNGKWPKKRKKFKPKQTINPQKKEQVYVPNGHNLAVLQVF